jgi:hypothetical protein
MWKRVIFTVVFAALALSAACAKGGPIMSMRAFRNAYVAEIRKERPSDTVAVVSADELRVQSPSGGDSEAFIDNAYAFYRQNPDQLQAILEQYVGTLAAAASPVPYTAEKLLVLVRSTNYLAALYAAQARSGQADSGPPYTRPIAPGLTAFVAEDQPTTYFFPPAEVLRSALKMDDAAIWSRALANTRRKLPGSPPAKANGALVALTTGEGLAASLMAVPDYWDAAAMQVGGPPVVAPVGKDMVLVTHLSHPSGIAALRTLARKSVDDPDGLIDQLYVRRAGAWEPLAP